MLDVQQQLIDEYIAALRRHLVAPSEETRQQACELGRRFIIEQSSVHKLVKAHHKALRDFNEDGALPSKRILANAAVFLAGVLSVYELTLRCYQDAYAQARLLCASPPPEESKATPS